MKIVYIDSQNIHQGLLQYHGWIIDWKNFYVYLNEKYEVDKVKIFFGYLKSQKGFYQKLKNIGYEVCFKETLVLPNGNIKGNVDIDIAIFALKDFYENSVSQAFLVTGDGDFNSLVYFWIEKEIFGKVIIPGVKNSSVLLKRVAKNNILDLAELKIKLKKEKLSNKT
ncbi:MAG: NYN domain-containing protein [Candidatus Gracilibacteria bacterium]|nr:NYN domain-containing protein [Candidatus Gracilibacteria bacterium]MDQ7023052.1 NYN domain-containing protein [Candidatus Gracilibacteria bacterium]